MENDFFVWSLIWRAAGDTFAAARETQEILWMNGATWVQLWSGIIGAVISSAVAAWVATTVLKRTLSEQRALSNEAQAAQMRLADVQLREQRAALEKQIAEQRQDAARQLHMQAREESRTREIAAMADLVAGADQMRKKFARGVPAIEETIFSMQAAAQRWSLEIQEKELSREVDAWPELIGMLGLHAYHRQKGVVAKLKADPEKFLSGFVGSLDEGLAMLLGTDVSDEEMLDQRQKTMGVIGEDLYAAIATLTKASRFLRRATRIRALSLPEGLKPVDMPSLASLMSEMREDLKSSSKAAS